MRRREVLGLIVLAAAAPQLALAAEVKTVPLKDGLHFLDLYLGLAPGERNRFYMAYRAHRGGRPAPDAKAAIVAPNGQRLAIPLDRDGLVTRLPTLAQLRSCQLEMTGPAFEFGVEMRPTLSPSTRIDPNEIAAALAQLNAAIAKSGTLALLAPKMTAAYFVDAGGGRALLADGAGPALPVFKAPAIGPTPYFEPAREAAATAVVLARTPSRILLGNHPGWS